jgi:SSS family solute:Na+ symporter
MKAEIDSTALAVFLFFFALVTIMGFLAARWRRPATLAHLDEWGLGGRQFGTWITWFLIGGDFYTAYTVIAVPALVYSVGAYGFFALPYTIIVYPFVFAVMPKLWQLAKDTNAVTAADVVRNQYRSRSLESRRGNHWRPGHNAIYRAATDRNVHRNQGARNKG